MVNKQINKRSRGTMFFDADILAAYNQAKLYSGNKQGRVASMLDVIKGKLAADPYDLMWTRYLTTTSGEFYGKYKGRVPVVIVSHDITPILNDEKIMKRSTKNLRDNSFIQLTQKEFDKLENGAYGPVETLRLADINAMREYPGSVLSYGEAADEDPLLIARLGPQASEFLRKHRDITRKEADSYYIITNDHRYRYMRKDSEITGGLLHIGQLINLYFEGESSVVSRIDVADLSSAGRFIAIEGPGELGKVRGGLEEIFRNFSRNWRKLLVPNVEKESSGFYTLEKIGKELFAEYEKEKGHTMRTGQPRLHILSANRLKGPTAFTTKISGYYGLFRYDKEDVKKIAPEGANAYLMGQPEIVQRKGDPTEHTAPIKFYNVKADTSQRILTEDEVRNNFTLLKKLID